MNLLLHHFLMAFAVAVLSCYYVPLSFAQENRSLQTFTSDEDGITWLDNFILSLISAGIATGLTAFATYKISHGLENKKEERNKKAEINFNIRVVQLISSEINIT